jgi:hypothetical protein
MYLHTKAFNLSVSYGGGGVNSVLHPYIGANFNRDDTFNAGAKFRHYGRVLKSGSLGVHF